MRKLLKFIILAIFIAGALGLGGWLITRHIIITKASEKALDIIEQALKEKPDPSTDEKIIAITAHVFKVFYHQDPAEIPLYRFRPLLTTHRLPGWFRLPDGVMETFLQKGYCDNAARMLAFTLKQEGFGSVQWNMVSPTTAHSALLITMPDDRKILADPFYGYVTIDDKDLLVDPVKAQNLLKNGANFKDVFLPLGKDSDPRFYHGIQNAVMGAQGDGLTLEATVPPLNDKILELGKIDGNDTDVKNAGAQQGLTPFWHYIGHKYNREWVRILKVTEPVRIVMTLLTAPESNVLNATPKPEINGKTLTWELKAEDTLTFRDADAKPSLKRLNSYIGVDQIVISSLN